MVGRKDPKTYHGGGGGVARGDREAKAAKKGCMIKPCITVGNCPPLLLGPPGPMQPTGLTVSTLPPTTCVSLGAVVLTHPCLPLIG